MKITHAILWNGKRVNTAISLAMAKQTKAGMERDYGGDYCPQCSESE